jgi:hypothetical protein
MKVILKGGTAEKNEEIKKFFMEKIFPILDFGIAIEYSDSIITVYEKKDDDVIEYVDPTAEVVVELDQKTISMLKDPKFLASDVREASGRFFDEARAIEKIEKLKPPFSVEYYSCRYTPKS